MFDEVVAAIDGSPASFRAAELGAQIAAAEGGSIALVAVAPQRSELAARLHLGGGDPEAAREQSEADLRSAEIVIGRTAPVRSSEVRVGPVIETIVGHCDPHKPQQRLICVGSGRQRLRLGSTSAGVLRSSDCAVLVVPEGTSRSPRIERILLGYDGTPGAEPALVAAGQLSARTGAEVRIVWVLRPAFPLPPEGMPIGGSEVSALAGEPERREMEAAAQRIRDGGGKVSLTCYELGRTEDRLLALAEAGDVDLIVVGARGRHPATRRMLGGVSDRIVHGTTRPVLVVK